jgi:predicted CXXCH cytochrome family protein
MKGDACLVCHRPHLKDDSGYYRVGSVYQLTGTDAPCIACHSPESWTANDALAALHPRDVTEKAVRGVHPLVDEAIGDPKIGCRTCHDPHSAKAPGDALLRTAEETGAATFCLSCHTDQLPILATGHNDKSLSAAGYDTNACQPCHGLHADRSELRDHLLTNGDTQSPSEVAELVKSGFDPLCAKCHGPNGGAKQPPIATHPDVPLANLVSPGEEGYLPLFGDDGRAAQDGHITCRTCHVAHGRTVPGARTIDYNDASATDAIHIAMRSHVRSLEPPNTCATCHGTDALRRFLYFHDAERRSGPISPNVPGSLWLPPG